MITNPVSIPKRTKRLSAEWLNEVLHESGYLKDCNIESIFREPCGVGEGFVSDMARLTITYEKESLNLPNTMVVKMPTTFRTALAVALQYNIYEKEIRFYREIAPISPIRVPGIIYSDYDSENKKYILILEDCACYHMVDQVEGLNYEQTKQAIKAIANFHARWWDSKDLFSFDWISKPRDETAMSFIDTFRSSWDLAKKSEEFINYLPEKGLEIGEKIYKNFAWLIESVPDENLTIAHFDYRADNLFFDSENHESPVVVIDWGSPVVIGGILDIAYLLGTSMKLDLRRKYEEELIRYYLKQLEENEILSYDFDSAKYDYIRSLMAYAYLVPLGFTQLDMSDPRAVELSQAYSNRLFGAIIDNDATSVFPI
ncbi:MAG: phosphotransferase [Candidatus Thorarchaeota archaeon]